MGLINKKEQHPFYDYFAQAKKHKNTQKKNVNFINKIIFRKSHNRDQLVGS